METLEDRLGATPEEVIADREDTIVELRALLAEKDADLATMQAKLEAGEKQNAHLCKMVDREKSRADALQKERDELETKLCKEANSHRETLRELGEVRARLRPIEEEAQEIKDSPDYELKQAIRSAVEGKR